jgi:hypothetical protein
LIAKYDPNTGTHELKGGKYPMTNHHCISAALSKGYISSGIDKELPSMLIFCAEQKWRQKLPRIAQFEGKVKL